MKLVEFFVSIQGEGLLAGVPSVFVRLAGCDRHCLWCDTVYAQDASVGREVSVEKLADEIFGCEVEHVIVTGGEPLLSVELPELLDKLVRNNNHVTLETSANVYLQLPKVFLSISPKLSNSQAKGKIVSPDYVSTIQQYINSNDYQLKFVVGSEADVDEVEDFLAQLTRIDRSKILLMPLAATRSKYHEIAPEVAQWCIERSFRFSPRLHIEIWGNCRGH